MNYIKHLTGFFDRIVKDRQLNPTHISLYIALFQYWNVNRFQNPISITRDEIMRISKICSKATYHKCMRELNDKGYIKYEPSYNPFKGSMVILFNFSEDLKPALKKDIPSSKILPVIEQVVNKQKTSSETSAEHAVGIFYKHTINNTNSSNDVNLGEHEKKIENKELINEVKETILEDDFENSKEKKLREKKKGFIEPNLDEVKYFFQQNNFPELEAQKFFNYFSSIGWLVGGKTPMTDWQAAAQNWMLNAENFNTKPIRNTDLITGQKPNHLTSTNEKNYAEPL
jgi:hypothetical protein